ncbi:heme-dependent oxidative N-demethylase family protein [Sneathiella aquimaris]|uniref:heme-dependent oxidative N-demethylase family protein n=1 Tax=Sneathiella aquimaris TaxID=2599305 RepID=UPI00146E643F|nr:DUF3445 domain-containing protein [Sneathiella aquimaris]
MSLPYFPIEKADFQHSMGLSALKESWLEVDENYLSQTAQKRNLLTNKRPHVLATLPGSENAQSHILDLVRQELNIHHPTVDQSPAYKPAGPLAQAASLVQEDLVLMQEVGGVFKLTAACVCFPSGWDLTEKVGHAISDIHIPVPDLNNRIGPSIDRFFSHLNPRKKVQRFNWGLFDDDALFQPGSHENRQIGNDRVTEQTIGDALFFRVEKQTLQRLPENRDTLFSIRIFNTPLSEVVSDQDRAARLLHALTTMDAPVRRYKAVARYEELLMAYLRKLAG